MEELRSGIGRRLRSALVVANPVSGRGEGGRAATELADGLRSRGIATELMLTERRGEAFDRLRTLDGPVDLVVAAGGDGTVREVLDGLVDPATPVGVLPFGTANVLAHSLGLPRDVHHALDILCGKPARAIDVARVNGRLSVLCVGVGFDARVVREVERRRSGAIKKSIYVRAFLSALRGYRPPRLSVEVDGKSLGEAGFVFVSNTPGYAGLVHLDPDTRLDDERWEAYLFQSGRPAELLRAGLRGLLRHLPGGPVSLVRARSFRITSPEPVPYQVDGDLGGTTPVEVELAPNQYRIVAP